MTAKGIIVVLSAVAVLGVVAAMVALFPIAAPTAAQGQTQPEATQLPPPPPTPTLELATGEDPETLAQMKKYCHDGQVYELYATVEDAGDGHGKIVLLEWWADLHYWELSGEETLAYYRIERQSHAKDAPTGDQWQVVDTVHTTNVWEGSVETGHWHYRVRLIGLVSGDLIHECQQMKWAEAEINVPTLQEELEQVCGIIYAYHVAATVEPSSDGQGETVTLKWESDIDYYLDHSYGYYDSSQLPEETVGNYRVERIPFSSDKDGGNWETVAEVSATNTWSGFSEPGDWIYRIALVSLQAGDVVGQCEKPHWVQAEVFVLTAEERAKEEADRLVLIDQASACALDALSDNLTPAARSVIGEYIDKRVGEIAEGSDFEAVVTMTVMFCTDREGGDKYYSGRPSRIEYILSTLFDGGYY